MLKDQLKVELKRWEHQFIDQNGRGPNKEDIRKLPDIKKMYKRYAMLRRETSTEDAPGEVLPSPDAVASHSYKALAVELGPTPQIHGKAMSIFEMSISPTKIPHAEPSGEGECSKESGQLSPTSTIPEDEANPRLFEVAPAVKRQLTFDSTALSLSPPKAPEDSTDKYYGPNSPLKWENENFKISIKHHSPLKRTPSKRINHTNTSFSPSPLVKRPLSRSLLELMREHEAIVEEFKNSDESNDTFVVSQQVDNIFTQEDDPIAAENSKTVKTKRRRILRRNGDLADDGPTKKDISHELEKLKRQRVNEFMGLEEVADDAEAKELDAHEQQDIKKDKPPQKTSKKRNKKYNLVSNNFRRLKLPKKSAANRRWGNRRR